MLAGAMLQYAAIVGLSSTTVLRYEDYIFEKGALIALIARRFGWCADDHLVELILEWADIRPQQEDPTSFIRRVTPGDHREKLRAGTIATLNEKLRPALELFGYPIAG
jgi:hypothetical protein